MVDVCIITEGSYPFVVGGVSTWVHELIKNLSDFNFALVHIGVSPELHDEPRYELPKNVVDFRKVYLLESLPWQAWRRKASDEDWESFRTFVMELGRGDYSRIDEMIDLFSVDRPDGLTPYEIFHGKRFWDLLVEIYERHFSGFPFLHYFWTIRFIALPLFKTIYAELPRAKLYHATCTGYAGLLGVVASNRMRSPFIITEHGIYTNERMIEITQAKWIFREEGDSPVPRRQIGTLQNLWMRKFELLSRAAYERASAIYTLYEGNRLLQIQGGAPREKCHIIPNGIDLPRFDKIASVREDTPRLRPTVAMVGRVAPIKDVKTFIRAARLVADEIPDCRFLIIGPTDEDEDYADECRKLVSVLALERNVEFTGPVRVDEYYPSIDCLVLTSISEAQPFVVLEAMRVGIPVVATNVGACAELILAVGPEDEAIGRAGAVTNVRAPEETAAEILRILKDPDLARQMGRAGRERVGRYYSKSKMLQSYEQVYRSFCGQGV